MLHDEQMNKARDKVREAMSILLDVAGPVGGNAFWAILDGNDDTWSKEDIKRFKRASKELRHLLPPIIKTINETMKKFDEVDTIPDG